MFTSTMKASAELELGRRHPYLVRYGPMLVAAVLLLALAGGAWWLVAKAAGAAGSVSAPARPGLPEVSVPTPSGALVLAVVGVLVLAGLAVAYWRSPYRVGWRIYL